MVRKSRPLLPSEILARNFARFREEAGLTQAEAVALGGITFSALTKIEQGLRGSPREKTLLKYAELYGRKVEHFWMENPPPPDEEALANRPIWRLQLLPGYKPDKDIAEKVAEAVAAANREQTERRRRKMKKEQVERGSASPRDAEEGSEPT